MLFKVRKSDMHGTVSIPGSKSHTIRALFIASLAEGRSVISHPLFSRDAFSAADVCRAFGARFEKTEESFVIDGFGGVPSIPENIVDVGNSGTSLRFALMSAGLADGWTVFTGDHQIRSRPLGPLIRAMNALGGNVFSIRGNDMAPVAVRGRLKGGSTELDSFTSQYLSSILINAPLLERDTEVTITRLNERPYVEMTMWWLDNQGIEYHNDDFKVMRIKGGQKYKAFDMAIPGDFSSATFFMVLAAVSGGEFVLNNLDMSDPQGDKKVLDYLAEMGAVVRYANNGIIIKGDGLKGIEIDMNSTPDALPAMAVAGCFAEGETRLVNVPQARMKETDRIKVMVGELSKMGADIEELPDGLVIRNSKLKGCRVNGHDDHRIVMALAVAGLNSEGETCIETAEAVNVTLPAFSNMIRECGGNIELVCEGHETINGPDMTREGR
ncbi:MAG: 3-phosphoshikimate 1-carboxyvinyltransferase [Clostridiaceae bacterium]|nr:3-phosphoshikimate 1-carboxyvinyltransferase [Clostridiaceae bacterium]